MSKPAYSDGGGIGTPTPIRSRGVYSPPCADCAVTVGLAGTGEAGTRVAVTIGDRRITVCDGCVVAGKRVAVWDGWTVGVGDAEAVGETAKLSTLVGDGVGVSLGSGAAVGTSGSPAIGVVVAVGAKSAVLSGVSESNDHALIAVNTTPTPTMSHPKRRTLLASAREQDPSAGYDETEANQESHYL